MYNNFTGIREERLKIDNQIFCFFDVGGQRNERRKWINCFDGVHGIIFVAALRYVFPQSFSHHIYIPAILIMFIFYLFFIYFIYLLLFF
jgi:hypothetical protein